MNKTSRILSSIALFLLAMGPSVLAAQSLILSATSYSSGRSQIPSALRISSAHEIGLWKAMMTYW